MRSVLLVHGIDRRVSTAGNFETYVLPHCFFEPVYKYGKCEMPGSKRIEIERPGVRPHIAGTGAIRIQAETATSSTCYGLVFVY